MSICPQLISSWDTWVKTGNGRHPLKRSAEYPNFDPIVPGTHAIFNELERRRTVDSGILYTLTSCCTRSFLAVLYALDGSELQINSLEATTSLAFLLHPETYQVPRSGLRHLTTLKLKLPITCIDGCFGAPTYFDPKSGTSWDCKAERASRISNHVKCSQSCKQYSILGDFISEASGLEELELEMDWTAPYWCNNPDRRHAYGPLERGSNEIALLGQHCWKHLKTLKLINFRCNPDSLVEFILRHKDTLKHIEFTNPELNGSGFESGIDSVIWYTFLQSLREAVLNRDLNLLTFSLHGVLGCGREIRSGPMVGVPPSNLSWVRGTSVDVGDESGIGELLCKWVLKPNGSSHGMCHELIMAAVNSAIDVASQ